MSIYGFAKHFALRNANPSLSPARYMLNLETTSFSYFNVLVIFFSLMRLLISSCLLLTSCVSFCHTPPIVCYFLLVIVSFDILTDSRPIGGGLSADYRPLVGRHSTDIAVDISTEATYSTHDPLSLLPG